MNPDLNLAGERHDRGGGDNALIDPGPIPSAKIDPKHEREAREALHAVTPPPARRKRT